MTQPAKPAPSSLSIIDMLDAVSDTVEISPGVLKTIRPLALEEMVNLLQENRPVFFALYTIANRMLGDPAAQSFEFGAVITTFPDIIAKIIAISMEEADIEKAATAIRKRMPVTVQLIAVEKIWKLSVPDPKKLVDLLSVVMGQLRTALDEQNKIAGQTSNDSPMTSAPPSNSSLPMDTPLETFDVTA